MLVRYLTGDPPDLADASAKVIDAEAELLISDVALVETAYVLSLVYGVPRETVVDHLIALLRKANIATFRLPKEYVLEALRLCRPSGRVSFADALIWAAARAEEATIYTLDDALSERIRHVAPPPKTGRRHLSHSVWRLACHVSE